MIVSKNCINLIKLFEGYKPKAYLCPASIVTIGWGSTMYTDGRKIKIGDTINEDQANELLMWELKIKSIALHGLNLNQNQFDSLLSFIYNLGIGAFAKSTLRKKVIANPNDVSIRLEFMKWNKATVDGKLIALKGLTRRRNAEADLYFSKV
ncbi:MAG: lysozyme [Caulobacteraceae bacterium]|nr:lysozyme [Caulobacteraceae bacterium]